MVVHQAVKPAVPGSNLASLQPAGTCWGASRVGMITAGWPLRGGRGKNYEKNTGTNVVPKIAMLCDFEIQRTIFKFCEFSKAKKDEIKALCAIMSPPGKYLCLKEKKLRTI